ncbi:hypothetical protein [Rhodohalobacter sp. 614A]|uniref:hypothetical protein n=1 Tax=Rhodohalobacter sp. 614A TaxID=2908649 RepID=UPI001F1A75AA|nr:hypothetical protein [Rhodohalobacter sp. 614A]
MGDLKTSQINKRLTNRIILFLQEIGIAVKKSRIHEETFLPGIKIERGEMLVDKDQLTYPGDLIHEAGHIALTPKSDRAKLNGNVDEEKNSKESLETGAILWSWAALTYLKLDPEIVFHQNGYRGASEWFIENFTSGNYIGLPLLQWMELCKHQDSDEGIPEFPHMIKWLRD